MNPNNVSYCLGSDIKAGKWFTENYSGLMKPYFCEINTTSQVSLCTNGWTFNPSCTMDGL